MESAVNSISPSEETVAKLQPLDSGANPLALEIAVNVAGARPASASGQRDLFSEDTSTVLIAENGAVIRLAAAVVTGQLLFLTDKRTNSEMVCQVVRKRTFRPTECYVELEFTEPAPNFWGLEIPAKTASPSQLETAQRVESAEPAIEDAPLEVPAAQGQGVAELKQEVEGLREQIRSLLQSKTQGAKAEAEAALQQSAKRAEAAAVEQSRIKPPAAPPAAPPPPPPNPPALALPPTDGKAPEAGAGAAPGATPTSVVRMALPKMTLAKEGGAKDSEAIDPLDCLLPKPNLDFSSAPVPGAANERRSLYDIYKPIRVGIGKFRLALFSGLLLGVVLCGAWYMNWLPVPSLGGIAQMIHPANSKKVERGGAHQGAPAMASRTAATPNATAPDSVTMTPADETPPQPVGGTVEGENAPNTEAPAPHAIAPANSAALKVKKPVAPTASPARAGAKEKAASAGSLRKNAPTAIPSATAEPTPPEPAASDATLVPPKLLKSASPVYPPDAMREYITGDVRVDALVEPDGRIGAMKILGGPVPLRQAALDALKQYEYAPATQGRRAVTAHITVTVKFWFNP
ncbi:MAG: TonB family protein [Candidatus Acidiferrum sp.]